jgi:branched-chain amino acid transport system substrate-binding protein
MTRRTRTFLMVLACLLALGAPARAQQTEPISDGVVKIGLLLDMTSLYADVTGVGSETAARMAVEDFGGTVLGKPVQVVVADTQSKPDTAVSMARQWFDQDHVDALVEVTGTSAALAVMQVAKDKNRIIVLNGPGALSITNENCTPVSFHWTFDTYALAANTAKRVVQEGGDRWFFLAADYGFGEQMVRDASKVVVANGGKVLGAAKVPLTTTDMSSFLLQAQSSGANVVGVANAGADAINTIKQAWEFGLPRSGQRLVGLLLYVNDVRSIGLEQMQGTILTTGFYWDRDEATRTFARRFFDRLKKMPNMSQAGVYSATAHYLKAVQAAGTDATESVNRKMREMPVEDFFAHGGQIRENGRMVHDMYLAQVKKPDESKEPWDLYRIIATIPGSEAFQPLAESTCSLLRR